MREFDDNPHSYGPVLRRIAILAAVVVMVPAMLWVITNFMRTYVAQPVIASPKPLLAPATTGSIDTASASAPAASPVVEARATATDSNSLAVTPKVASPDTPPSAAPGAAPQPSLNTGAAPPAPAGGWPTANAANSAPANSPPANSGPWPDPSQAIGEQQLAAPAATAAANSGDDALPPTPPLTGPIPLPPHRPAVVAMAVTGAVPLPRARPADAAAPAEGNPDGSGSNFFTHLFGQTH